MKFLFDIRCSLFAVRCSLFAIRFSLLAIRRWFFLFGEQRTAKGEELLVNLNQPYNTANDIYINPT